MEEAIDQIVAFFKHAAQGLEEKKQILYLLGPVGGGKSSIAERLKAVMEARPIYAIKGSPVNESPLGLFPPERFGAVLEADYGIPRRYLSGIMSPWAVKRLQEFGGDLSKFRVVRINPSVLRQVAITKTEPGDENNQDISSLVGKVDIRKLEHLSQNDPDAYSYSGGLCLANQGLLEFVEMFKAPIKMLHPLLTATQEGNFKGTEGFSAIPFNGLIVAHSNESEWHSFRNNKNNEAFLDRIYIVKVPYCVRVSRGSARSTGSCLTNSSLAGAPCAPGTLEMMAQFSVLTRLEGAGELEHLLQDARLRRRDAEGRRSEGQDAAGIPRLRRHGRRHDRACRRASPTRSCPRCSTTTRPRSPPTRCISCTSSSSGSRARTCRTRQRRRCVEHVKGISRRATPSSSARRSRPPISSRMPSTARTSSTAT